MKVLVAVPMMPEKEEELELSVTGPMTSEEDEVGPPEMGPMTVEEEEGAVRVVEAKVMGL